MDKPFEIKFDFPLEHSNYTIPLRAVAELHHSDPYYVIDAFNFVSQDPSKQTISLLPPIEIKYLRRGSKAGAWVHKDSERESLLSRAIGKAIENSGQFIDK
jgi:hypothetical protein